VIEAELLFELLMRLPTDPSRFDRGGELLEARIGWFSASSTMSPSVNSMP
jgi:hypothetical protein